MHLPILVAIVADHGADIIQAVDLLVALATVRAVLHEIVAKYGATRTRQSALWALGGGSIDK